MIHIVFGTESGNSEMAADDMASFLQEVGQQAEVVAMDEYDVSELPEEGFVVIITSTYGEGELPETAQPFFKALQDSQPDLSELKFAAFGLGDSTYETYSNGIDVIAGQLVALGATQLGVTGRHDAAKTVTLEEVSKSWIKEVFYSFN